MLDDDSSVGCIQARHFDMLRMILSTLYDGQGLRQAYLLYRMSTCIDEHDTQRLEKGECDVHPRTC